MYHCLVSKFILNWHISGLKSLRSLFVLKTVTSLGHLWLSHWRFYDKCFKEEYWCDFGTGRLHRLYSDTWCLETSRLNSIVLSVTPVVLHRGNNTRKRLWKFKGTPETRSSSMDIKILVQIKSRGYTKVFMSLAL